jgi:hypothetical protein
MMIWYQFLVMGQVEIMTRMQKMENVGGDGIAVVPVIPISYFVAHIGSEKEILY